MPRQSYARRRPYRPDSYNFSSTAYEYYPTYAYPYPQYEEKAVPVRPKKKEKYKTKEESTVYSGRIAIGITVFFCFTLAALCTSIDISDKRQEIINLTSQLESINETNNHIEMELNKSIDLSAIEKTAITKLGMQSPTKYQTVYIDVPKDSYTVQYTQVEPTNTNKADSFLNQLTKIFKAN